MPTFILLTKKKDTSTRDLHIQVAIEHIAAVEERDNGKATVHLSGGAPIFTEQTVGDVTDAITKAESKAQSAKLAVERLNQMGR